MKIRQSMLQAAEHKDNREFHNVNCTTESANEIREIIIYALLATLSKSLAESRFAFLVECA